MPNSIVGVGGANMDMHAQSRDAVVMRDSNPCFIHTSPGGVTRNILENLARQGMRCTLLSAVGTDAFGERILRACADVGIDVSRVHIEPRCPSSCYLALMDETGDMLLGASDMRIMDTISKEYLLQNAQLLRQADAIVCDANPSADFLKSLVEIVDGKTKIFMDPVSTAHAHKLFSILGRFYLIKPNLLELETLSGMKCGSEDDIRAAAASLLEQGVECVIVSLGSRGCYYADRQERQMFRQLRRVENMANATGAGDAFMAGIVHGVCDGMEPDGLLDYALASGIVAVQSEETISLKMSDALVRKTIEEYSI